MNFREVVPAVVELVGQTGVLNEDHELTIVRDVQGLVRLIVRVDASATRPVTLPEAAAVATLETALRTRLGRWLGTPAVWLDDRGTKGAAALALKLARDQQELAPWPRKTGDPKWLLLERHAAKRTWTGEVKPRPPWPIEAVDSRGKPPIVTFFSHKGGVGRTTALAAVALHLARAKWRVALVDMDIEAPGLGSLFLPDAPKVGVLDFLVETSPAPATTARDVTSFVGDTRFVGDGAGIQLVPAGELDDDFVQMLARIDLQDTALDSALAERIRALVDQLRRDFSADIILVDARTGLHEVAGLMLSGLSHAAVVVGTNSPQSAAGLRRVARLLATPYDRTSSEPRPLVLVHGMAPTASDPRQVAEEAEFRTTAYDVLSEEYYPEGQVPQQDEPTRPHVPIVVRWTQDLRGGGGVLADAAIQVLLTQPYRNLAERILAQFGRRLEERQ